MAFSKKKKHPIKKVWNHLPCFHCFGDDEDALIYSGIFLFLELSVVQDRRARKYQYQIGTYLVFVSQISWHFLGILSLS